MTAACLMDRSTSLIRDPGARPALSPALASVRLDGVVFAAADLSPPWGVVMPRVPDQIAIYIHTQGSGFAVFNEPERHIQLADGDLLMVKGAVWHGMSDQPGRALQPLARALEEDGRFVADSDDEVFSTLCRLRLAEARVGAGCATTKVLTLRAFTEPRAPSPLLQSLPDAVHLPGFWLRHRRFWPIPGKRSCSWSAKQCSVQHQRLRSRRQRGIQMWAWRRGCSRRSSSRPTWGCCSRSCS